MAGDRFDGWMGGWEAGWMAQRVPLVFTVAEFPVSLVTRVQFTDEQLPVVAIVIPLPQAERERHSNNHNHNNIITTNKIFNMPRMRGREIRFI